MYGINNVRVTSKSDLLIMSLKPGPGINLSASMQNLDTFKDEEEITFKDKIKRTFSSIKRRHKKQIQSVKMPEPKQLQPPKISIDSKQLQAPSTSNGHKPLRAVKSNPFPSAERYVLHLSNLFYFKLILPIRRHLFKWLHKDTI